MYNALTDAEKAMKKMFISFFDSEIHCWDVIEGEYGEERKKLFGTFLILFWLWSVTLHCFLLANYFSISQMTSKIKVLGSPRLCRHLRRV